MMAVDATTAADKCGPASQVGIPQALFTAPDFVGMIRSHQYDTRDGKKFLIREPSEAGAGAPITVVLNWTAMLKK